MNEGAARLTTSWKYWSALAGLKNATVTDDSDRHVFHFQPDQYAFHLRRTDGWWVVDTLDDRNQLHSDTAKFTTFELAEKYLVWQWSSTARHAQRLPRLGPKLYAQGMAADLTLAKLSEGIYSLFTPAGEAVLMEPSATIFSHLVSRSVDDIEESAKTGINTCRGVHLPVRLDRHKR